MTPREPQIWLLEVRPRTTADGQMVTVQLAGGGKRGFTQLGSRDWQAGLVRPPVIVQKLGFSGADGDGGGFGDGAIVQALSFDWQGRAKDAAQLASYYWRDARFTLLTGADGADDAALSIVLKGRIAECTAEPGGIKLAMVDPALMLDRPVLANRFAGTGGIEGPAELKGQVKWRAWGKVHNVTLRSLDPASNIWVATDPAFALTAIDQVYDRGNAASSLTLVAWQGNSAATLTALQAAPAPQGGAAIAPSIGCIKWWFANPGRLTADLRGEAIPAGNAPADIAAALAVLAIGPTVDASLLSAARTARPDEAGWLVADESATIAGEMTALLSGASLWWALSATGVIEIGPWSFTGSSAGTLGAARIDRTQSFRPINKVSLGWKRNYTVMARGDIAAGVLEALSDPAKLSIPEKRDLAVWDADVANRHANLLARAVSLGLATTTAMAVASAWQSYRNALDPAWTDLTRETAIVRPTYEAKRSDWTTALNALDAAISAEDANRATWANVTGTGRPADNATVGAIWGNNISSLPANLASLGGTEAIRNTQIGISGGVFSNPGSAGDGTEIANDRLVLATDAVGAGGRGRVILNRAGGALGNNVITLPAAVQNLDVTVASGVLTGIGTSGVPVDNRLQQWADVAGAGRPADGATVGAAIGTNLRSSLGAILRDQDIVTGSMTAAPGGMLPNWNLDLQDANGRPAFLRVVETFGVADSFWGFSDANRNSLKLSGGQSFAVGFPAMPVDDRQAFTLRIRHRSSAMSANGLYIRAHELNGTLPNGTTHVGVASNGVVAPQSSQFDIVQNGSMPGTSYIEHQFNYIPTAGVRFVTISFYNWGSGVDYEVDWVQCLPALNEGRVNALALLNGPAEPSATLGASWGTNLIGRPANLAALSGSEGIRNALIGISGGMFSNPGASGHGIEVANALLFISSNGSLVGGGGGQVTLPGLGGGALATLNALDPRAAAFLAYGSVPPTVPDGSFSYSSTISSITLNWGSFTIYRADLSAVTIASGSVTVTGLSSATSYKVYPYMVDNGGSSGTITWAAVAGGVGSPAIAYSGSSALAAATMYGKANIPLNGFAVSTTASGTGGGGGGGNNCLHPATLVGDIAAGDLRCGGLVPCPDGMTPIIRLSRKICSRWFAVTVASGETVRVTADHRFLRASGGEVRAIDIRLGDLLAARGDHQQVIGLALDSAPASLVSIELEAPHLYYLGRTDLLSHNPKP